MEGVRLWVGDLVYYVIVVGGFESIGMGVIEEWIVKECVCEVFFEVFEWFVVLVILDWVGEGLVVVDWFVEIDYDDGVVGFCVCLWILLVVEVVVKGFLWFVVY